MLSHFFEDSMRSRRGGRQLALDGLGVRFHRGRLELETLPNVTAIHRILLHPSSTSHHDIRASGRSGGVAKEFDMLHSSPESRWRPSAARGGAGGVSRSPLKAFRGIRRIAPWTGIDACALVWACAEGVAEPASVVTPSTWAPRLPSACSK